MINKILHGDCVELMNDIATESIDMILCDLPYGTTACKWDTIIPFDKLWEQYERIIKPNGWIVLFGSQPFTTKLINSNIDNFSHQWIWNKKMCVNPYLVKQQPIKNFEDIICFNYNYKKHDTRRVYFDSILKYIAKNKSDIIKETNQGLDHCFRTKSTQFGIPTLDNYLLLIDRYGIDKMDGFLEYDKIDIFKRTYNPEMQQRGKPVKKGFSGKTKEDSFLGVTNMNTISFNNEYYPTAIIEFSGKSKKEHPTAKPVELIEYLIKTYTNENDLVLDSTAGSGTTAIACINTNRNYICMEKDSEYYNKSIERILKHSNQLSLNI